MGFIFFRSFSLKFSNCVELHEIIVVLEKKNDFHRMKLFFSTDEVAQQLEIPVTTVDFYVRSFRMNIQKVGKNRKYSHADIEKLQKIVDLINKEGFTLEGAKEKLKHREVKTSVNEEVVTRLKEIRKTLEYIKLGLEL